MHRPPLPPPPQLLQSLEAYRTELSKPDEEVQLLQCAIHIARHAYPDLQPQEVYRQIDEIAARVEAVLPPLGSRYPLRVIKCINQVRQ